MGFRKVIKGAGRCAAGVLCVVAALNIERLAEAMGLDSLLLEGASDPAWWRWVMNFATNPLVSHISFLGVGLYAGGWVSRWIERQLRRPEERERLLGVECMRVGERLARITGGYGREGAEIMAPELHSLLLKLRKAGVPMAGTRVADADYMARYSGVLNHVGRLLADEHRAEARRTAQRFRADMEAL